jgi:O-antigen/teichoic acid export membrane protein
VPLYANSFYLMLNSGIVAILGFVFWLLAARFYDAEDVGLASAAISAIQLLSLLSLLGLNFSLIRFLANSRERSNDLINSCFTIGALMSLITAAIFMLGVRFWSPALASIQENGLYFVSFIVFTVGSTLLALVNHVFIAERRAGFVLSQNTATSLLKVGLVITLALFFQAFGILFSWGLAILVVIVVWTAIFLPRVHTGYRPSVTIRGDLTKEIFRYSLMNYLSDLLWNAPTFLLPIIVINLLNAEQNAYFYIAWTIGGILGAFSRAISLSLFAEGSFDNEQLWSNVRRSIKFTLVLLLPAILVLLLVGDKLLLVFGQGYSENGTDLLRLMVISALPVSVNYIYLSMRRVENRLKRVVGLAAFVMATTLTLSYILLPGMGLPGAGIAWLSAHTTAAVVIIVGWLRRMKGSI